MKAWQVHAWGEPETMVLAEVALPHPGAGQVRIRNRAAGLNFFDILQVQGKYQVKPPFPFTPGAEVAGVVEETGPEVKGLAAGDRVMALTYADGLGECTAADAARTFRIPEGMGFAEAAAMPIAYHTSYFALGRRAGLRAGETLLVHAGASGVGTSAIQIGQALGARVLATAGSAEKLEFCRAQGAEQAFGYGDGGWVERVMEATGKRGVDVIYDPVGGDVFDLSTKCLAAEGRLLVIGFTSGRIPAVQANRLLLKNISVVGVLWGRYAQSQPQYLGQAQEALERMYEAGQIRPVVGKTYPLEAAPAGLRHLAERRIMGKAVVVME